mgnify:CR=1 FL=1
MDPLESVKHNKNLLRVAAELGGIRTEGGNNEGIDELENVAAKTETPVVAENDQSDVDEINETVKNFTDVIMAQLVQLEEELDTELVDEDLDFAISKIIDSLLSKD